MPRRPLHKNVLMIMQSSEPCQHRAVPDMCRRLPAFLASTSDSLRRTLRNYACALWRITPQESHSPQEPIRPTDVSATHVGYKNTECPLLLYRGIMLRRHSASCARGSRPPRLRILPHTTHHPTGTRYPQESLFRTRRRTAGKGGTRMGLSGQQDLRRLPAYLPPCCLIRSGSTHRSQR